MEKNFNKKMLEALLSSILKDGSTPVFCKSKPEKYIVNNINRRIIFGYELVSIKDSETIEYVRVLNCHGD